MLDSYPKNITKNPKDFLLFWLRKKTNGEKKISFLKGKMALLRLLALNDDDST